MSRFDNLTSGLYKRGDKFFSVKKETSGFMALGTVGFSWQCVLQNSSDFSWRNNTQDYTVDYHMPKDAPDTEFIIPLEFLS